MKDYRLVIESGELTAEEAAGAGISRGVDDIELAAAAAGGSGEP